MFQRLKPVCVAFLIVVLAITATVIGIALADDPGEGNLIHGCYHKGTGILRIADDCSECRRGEICISFLESYTETDPVYSASTAAGITSGDIAEWDTAYGWGDHASAGYLTGETDPQVGSNTQDYIPVWDGSALVKGTIYDDGNIGIGTSSPTGKFEVMTGNSFGPAALDQSQTSYWWYRHSDPDSWQSFTPGVSGQLTRFDVFFARTATHATYTLSIYQGEGVGGTLLHTESVPGGTAYIWKAYTLSTPVNVTAGSKYTWRLQGTPGGVYGGTTLCGVETNPYPSGRADRGTEDDYTFTTYVAPPIPDLLVTSEGALIVPRMTTVQRDALTAVNGMIIYNTSTNEFNFYENGVWVTK